MEILKEILRKYLKHAAIVIALGGGAYLTVTMDGDQVNVDVTTQQE